MCGGHAQAPAADSQPHPRELKATLGKRGADSPGGVASSPPYATCVIPRYEWRELQPKRALVSSGLLHWGCGRATKSWRL